MSAISAEQQGNRVLDTAAKQGCKRSHGLLAVGQMLG